MIEELNSAVKSKAAAQNLSFWFVRHGESEGNVLADTCPIMHDSPLTERGKQEAQGVAEYLQKNDIQISHIFTSSKGRSRQTADIIASALGLPIAIKAGFDERNWGVWADLRWEEASNRLDGLTLEERYTFVPEGGESWQQMEKRLFTTLEEVADESTGGENVLIVTHKGCLRAIMPKLAKAGLEKHKDFSVSTGSLSKFSFEKDEFDFVGLSPMNL
ncbi:MAG: histidine phosphatase family protein [Patescibacteria group bacterium]